MYYIFANCLIARFKSGWGVLEGCPALKGESEEGVDEERTKHFSLIKKIRPIIVIRLKRQEK